MTTENIANVNTAGSFEDVEQMYEYDDTPWTGWKLVSSWIVIYAVACGLIYLVGAGVWNLASAISKLIF